MTASELLYSVDGKVRLDVNLGLSTLTVKSVHGGESIVKMINDFPGWKSGTILNAPARIKDPHSDFTVVLVNMYEVKKSLRSKK